MIIRCTKLFNCKKAIADLLRDNPNVQNIQDLIDIDKFNIYNYANNVTVIGQLCTLNILYREELEVCKLQSLNYLS